MPRPSAADKLTQLKALHLDYHHHLTQPQLPSLLSLHVRTDDLQTVSPVAATLQKLELYAPHIDFALPNTLAHFTRLHTLSLVPATIRNFSPEVLPPSLGSITINGDVRGPPTEADKLAIPAGGHIVETFLGPSEYAISWTRHSEDGLAIESRRKLNGMLAPWTFDHHHPIDEECST